MNKIKISIFALVLVVSNIVTWKAAQEGTIPIVQTTAGTFGLVPTVMKTKEGKLTKVVNMYAINIVDASNFQELPAEMQGPAREVMASFQQHKLPPAKPIK